MKRWIYAGAMALAVAAMGQTAAEAEPLTVYGTAPNGIGGFDRQEVRLSYDDLNLADPRDVGTLYARIDRAAEKACEIPPRARLSARAMLQMKSCRARAAANAIYTAGLRDAARVRLANAE